MELDSLGLVLWYWFGTWECALKIVSFLFKRNTIAYVSFKICQLVSCRHC